MEVENDPLEDYSPFQTGGLPSSEPHVMDWECIEPSEPKPLRLPQSPTESWPSASCASGDGPIRADGAYDEGWCRMSSRSPCTSLDTQWIKLRGNSGNLG